MAKPNPEPLFVSDALLEQAEKVSRARLAKDPDNLALLGSFSDVLRKQGNLAGASTVCERLLALDPLSPDAAYRRAIFSGLDIPAPPAGIQPAPFLVLKDFLPKAIHETLLPFALSAQDQLVRATVGNDEYRPDTREALHMPGKWEVEPEVRKHVKAILPEVISRLHVDPFEIGKVEVKFRTYLDGHFFRLHMDCPANSPANVNRRVSYVYFFHKMPRAYSGGDLLLFDTDMTNNKFTTAGLTRVRPEDNAILFFPSACYHSVVPVICPSKAFEDSRFVINGHISRRVESKPAADAPPDAGVAAAS